MATAAMGDEVRATLEDALSEADIDPDNPVGAVRIVARVARGFRPVVPTHWNVFRYVAQDVVRPYFEARDMDPAKAAVWAVGDPYYGKLQRDSTPPQEAKGTKGDRGTRKVSVAVANGAP